MRNSPLLPLAVLSICITVPAAAQQHAHAGDAHQVGRVAFATSCSPEVAPRFEQAVAMLHSFWFEQAEAAFQEVLAADPRCAMAHWGIAMTLLGNPMARVSPPPERLAQALAEARRATALAATATERERAYARAAAALYEGYESRDHFERMRLHEEALRNVHESFPDDPEATIFYARAVVANAPPNDLTFERQLHAASLLEPLFESRPDHPGLAHYIIHAFDAPAVAEHGLDAARRYAEIAPAAPHALHMPSHIFTRLGYWDESIEMNQRSARAEPNPDAAVHPMDYMVYAYLQQGRDELAGEVVGRAVDLPNRFYGGLLGYNFTAMPARFALERGDWSTAAQLTVPTGATPFVEAIARFGRAVGSARSGQADAADAEVAALAALRDELGAANEAYWTTIVEAQRLAASAWVARARGDDAAAIRLAREAAELEETVEKHPVTPGPLLPARELEADLLLELGRPAEALASYEKTLEREPRRARALFGAARAAEMSGDRDKAAQRYQELLAIMDRADATRPEPRAARAFLDTRGEASR